MNFSKLNDIALRPGDVVFKASPIGKGIGMIAFWSLAIAALIFAVRGGIQLGGAHIPVTLLYILTAVFGICGLVSFFLFRASLQPTNWLMRCTSGGILLHYRSYLNWRFSPDDIQVISLDFSEIAWARTVKERRKTPSMDGNHSSEIKFLTYLDLGLINPDTSALEANLQREVNYTPSSGITTRDYPISVSPGGIIEIRWGSDIRPSLAKALQILGQHVTINAAEKRTTDLTFHREESPEQQEAKIVALVKNGDGIGAVELARKVHGFSLTQAHDYVAKLSGDEDGV